ncbi:phosphopantetheine-binding protein, partial [Pelomonas sp. CA6]|uniref:phosphopantetheine-binding protein n=1 Tax=Pelomonas sp. CA6 TaxID=2907999 RepID=UPI001F4BDA48
RKALPAPDLADHVHQGYEAPRGALEERLAALWAEVLQLPQVGRHDNFFELGGHSLLAVSLMERMRQAGLPGDVKTLFAAPSLEALARALAGQDPAPQPLAVPANLIPAGATAITPEMLPLVALSQAQIDALVATVPG